MTTIIMGRWSGSNSQRVASLSCQAGYTQPEPLLLALTGWHKHSMIGKGMTTLPSLANLLHVNS